MCLGEIFKKFKPNDRIKIGYKLFFESADGSGTFQGQFFNQIKGFYKLGECYKATNDLISTGYDSYPSGFHCYSRLKDARKNFTYKENMVIVEVMCWDIRVNGSQNARKVFVAKNMRLMKVVKRSPKYEEKDPFRFKKYQNYLDELKKVLELDKKDFEEAQKHFINITTKNFDQYVDILCIIDRQFGNRMSKEFRTLTDHHVKSMRLSKEYREFYWNFHTPEGAEKFRKAIKKFPTKYRRVI